MKQKENSKKTLWSKIRFGLLIGTTVSMAVGSQYLDYKYERAEIRDVAKQVNYQDSKNIVWVNELDLDSDGLEDIIFLNLKYGYKRVYVRTPERFKLLREYNLR